MDGYREQGLFNDGRSPTPTLSRKLYSYVCALWAQDVARASKRGARCRGSSVENHVVMPSLRPVSPWLE